MTKHLLWFFVLSVTFLPFSTLSAQEKLKGASKEKLLTLYSKAEERTSRSQENKEWITFNYRVQGDIYNTITFFLEDGVVKTWKVGDRSEVVQEYLNEFCAQVFLYKYGRIYEAIRTILEEIPNDIFLNLTDRRWPVVFTEICISGSARLADSSYIRIHSNAPPTFMNGVRIIKLSSELNEADSLAQIKGIVAHELAHCILEHSVSSNYDERIEKKANTLVIDWGFETEFYEAKKRFKDHHL